MFLVQFAWAGLEKNLAMHANRNSRSFSSKAATFSQNKTGPIFLRLLMTFTFLTLLFGAVSWVLIRPKQLVMLNSNYYHPSKNRFLSIGSLNSVLRGNLSVSVPSGKRLECFVGETLVDAGYHAFSGVIQTLFSVSHQAWTQSAHKHSIEQPLRITFGFLSKFWTKWISRWRTGITWMRRVVNEVVGGKLRLRNILSHEIVALVIDCAVQIWNLSLLLNASLLMAQLSPLALSFLGKSFVVNGLLSRTVFGKVIMFSS
jgi:hypothetical protein